LTVKCPIDGKDGASYVHSVAMTESEDHVGTATHMLSYTWVSFTHTINSIWYGLGPYRNRKRVQAECGFLYLFLIHTRS